MSTRKTFVFILVFLSTAIAGIAQVSSAWKKSFESEILWQQVTSLGNLIVCTRNNLLGLNTESGNVLWKNSQFGGIMPDQLQEVSNSPFVTVEKNNSVILLEPFGGEVIFDSKKEGVGEIGSYFFLYRVNGILLSGKKAGSKDPIMLMVDMSTGDVLWNINEKFGRIIAATELSGSEILVVTLFNNYKIDVNSGNIAWKSATSAEASQVENMGAFGNLMKSMAEEMTKDMDININYYKHPVMDVFYLGSENENTSTMGSSTTVTYENTYNAYNISDGSLVWDQPIEMSGQMGQVAFDEGGLIILPNDGNRTKINMFDYNSKEGKWGKKGNGIAIKGGVYDYVDTDRGYLLVTTNGNNTFLNVLDAGPGTLTFDKPVKVDGYVVGTVSTPRGIFYITTEEVNILDPQTGDLFFAKSIPTRPELTAERDNFIYVFDTKENNVVAIDKNEASVKTLTTIPIKFNGKEDPARMELSDQGIFISSDQNIALVGYDGKIVYQNYFEAPKESGLKKALLYAQAVRAAYIGANAYYAAGVLQNAAPKVGEEDAVAGAVVQGFGKVYQELGDAAADYTVAAFKRANQRFKATAEGRDFLIILAQKDKTNALLKVSKITGKEEGFIDLGKDKEPVYSVDDITGQIFQKTASGEITSYKF